MVVGNLGFLQLNNTAYVWPDVKFNDNHWIIFVRIYKNGGKDPVEIKQSWLNGADMPAGLEARYSTISWKTGGEPVGGKTDTIIKVGHQGRNVLTQAILEISAKYDKQKEKHADETATLSAGGKIPPASLKVFDTDLDDAKLAEFGGEWWTQRKYNGTRCMARLIGNKVHLYSRHLHNYDVPDIAAELKPYLAKASAAGIVIDGELYIHHENLQTISGIVRGSNLADKTRLVYVMFDLINTKDMSMIFSARYNKLKSIFDGAKKPLIIAPAYSLGTSADVKAFKSRLDHKYKEFLAEGYEGCVLRNDNVYQPAWHGKHTDYIYKHKPVRTAEFPCIGFTEGKGKDKGAIIWICETPRTHHEFSVRPKMPTAERKELYRELKASPNLFNRRYKGKPLTIEFAELSADGLPQQPRALLFRTYE